MAKETDKKHPEETKAGPQTPADPFAAAAAVGFAMATSAMQMWFGVVSGMARAGQEMLERQSYKDSPPAYSPGPKPAATVAKAAARSVIAEVERATATVVAAAADIAEKPVAPVKEKPAVPTPKVKAEAEKPTNVVSLKPEVVAEAVTAPEPPTPMAKPVIAKAVADKPAAKPAAPKAEAALPEKKAETPAVAKAVVAKLVVAKPASEKPPEKPAVLKVKAVVQPEKKVETPVAAKAVEAMPFAVKAVEAKQVAPVAAVSGAKIMPEDFRAPPKLERPDAPDDLKRLPGVGPKLEQVLNGLGVWTYGQVAAWAPEEVAYVEDMTGLNGRIAADRWLEQAQSLSNDVTKH